MFVYFEGQMKNLVNHEFEVALCKNKRKLNPEHSQTMIY